MAQKVAKATAANYAPSAGSKPMVIAKLISKAINSNKPKTRYAAGKLAKPMMFIRKYFGDRIFDAAVMSQVK
jgi:hypothetical protein